MFRTLKGLFTGDTAEKAVDAVIRTGDKLVFTDEERSEASMSMLQLKAEYARQTMGYRVARRVLAFAFAGVFLVLVVVGVAAAAVEIALLDTDPRITNIEDVLQNAPIAAVIYLYIGEFLVWPVTAIMSFYFLINSLRGSK